MINCVIGRKSTMAKEIINPNIAHFVKSCIGMLCFLWNPTIKEIQNIIKIFNVIVSDIDYKEKLAIKTLRNIINILIKYRKT